MGRHIFVTEEKVLLNYFYCAPNFFLLAAQLLLKIKVSIEPCLVSVVVLMRGCSGTVSMRLGRKKNYSILTTKTRLHHWHVSGDNRKSGLRR